MHSFVTSILSRCAVACHGHVEMTRWGSPRLSLHFTSSAIFSVQTQRSSKAFCALSQDNGTKNTDRKKNGKAKAKAKSKKPAVDDDATQNDHAFKVATDEPQPNMDYMVAVQGCIDIIKSEFPGMMEMEPLPLDAKDTDDLTGFLSPFDPEVYTKQYEFPNRKQESSFQQQLEFLGRVFLNFRLCNKSRNSLPQNVL